MSYIVVVKNEQGLEVYTSYWSSPQAAALDAARQTRQAEQTTGYVQNVPDRCDRIIWRNRYYHLPLKSNDEAIALLREAQSNLYGRHQRPIDLAHRIDACDEWNCYCAGGEL